MLKVLYLRPYIQNGVSENQWSFHTRRFCPPRQNLTKHIIQLGNSSIPNIEKKNCTQTTGKWCDFIQFVVFEKKYFHWLYINLHLFIDVNSLTFFMEISFKNINSKFSLYEMCVVCVHVIKICAGGCFPETFIFSYFTHQ